MDTLKIDDKVYVDEELGFIRNKKLLSKQAWDEYYQNKYFQEVKPTYFEEKRKYSQWEELHFKRSKKQLSRLNTEGISMLDIGCGYGGFIYFLKQYGFEVEGIKPSRNFIEFHREMDLNVHTCSFEDFSTNKKYDFINMSFVLEHVMNPTLVIQKAKALLNPNGIIRIEVPNDFNSLQENAVKTLGLKKWWIVDEHLNYFNHQSLRNYLRKQGCSILHQTTTFPMEQFILMGLDYISNGELGSECHKKRVNFEINMQRDNEELLWNYYDQLVPLGMGRESIIYATLNNEGDL